VFGHTRSVRLVGKFTDYLFIVANTPLIEIRNGRVAKAASLRAIGLNPYPSRSGRTHYTKSIIDDFAKLDGTTATVAGRLMSWRKQGALAFAHVQDQTGQAAIVSAPQSGPADGRRHGRSRLRETNLLDMGDIIEATGKVVRTERGEISVLVEICGC
jgi:lysyl-tRNA synthetase, class II